jgi:hypothetical protein
LGILELHRILSEKTSQQASIELIEMSSRPGELYHFTKLLYAVKIIRNDSFQLALSVGEDVVDTQPRDKYYYFSTTRQFSNVFGHNLPVRLNLDGRLLRSRLHSSPVDYWNSMTVKYPSIKRKDSKKHEAEERFYSGDAVLKNARKYIFGVDISWEHVFTTSEKQMAKDLIDRCLSKDIPITVYYRHSDFLNKRRGDKWEDSHLSTEQDLESIEDEQPKIWTNDRPLSPLQFINHLLLLKLIGGSSKDFYNVFLNDEGNKSLFYGERQEVSYPVWLKMYLEEAENIAAARLDNIVRHQKSAYSEIEQLIYDIKHSSRVYQDTISSKLDSLFSSQLRKHKVDSKNIIQFLVSRVPSP